MTSNARAQRRYFVKAVSAEPNPTPPAYHRREARIVGALPATAPVPRLLWTYDDGDRVLLVFEDVAGTHPAEPWRDDELARVLAAIAGDTGDARRDGEGRRGPSSSN